VWLVRFGFVREGLSPSIVAVIKRSSSGKNCKTTGSNRNGTTFINRRKAENPLMNSAYTKTNHFREKRIIRMGILRVCVFNRVEGEWKRIQLAKLQEMANGREYSYLRYSGRFEKAIW